MADSFAKIWESILDSSIWSTDKATRLVWIALLVMKDEHGFVGASVDGIARRANVTEDEARAAIQVLESPDPDSRDIIENPDNEGRRIQRVARGWHVINHEHFKKLRDAEARKEYERERKREQRQRKRREESGTGPGQVPDESGNVPVSAHAEEEEEADGESIDPSMGTPVVDQNDEGDPAVPVQPKPDPTPKGANAAAIKATLARARAANAAAPRPR